MAFAALGLTRRLALHVSTHLGRFRQANTSAAESFMAELQVQVVAGTSSIL